MINLKSKYKTRQGDKVRSLKQTRVNWPGSALPLELIGGEFQSKDAAQGGRLEWINGLWTLDGKHQYAQSLDLIYIPEVKESQVSLLRPES